MVGHNRSRMAGTRHSAQPGDELCKIRPALDSQWIYDWSMASRIRIGVQIAPQHSPRYSHIRDAVLRCEDLGVDIAFNWDHFFPLYGDPEGTHYECWTMLAAWAEQTSRIEMGA